MASATHWAATGARRVGAGRALAPPGQRPPGGGPPPGQRPPGGGPPPPLVLAVHRVGPWVQADLENGLFAGGNGSDPANKGNSAAFVTAIMNNNGTSAYAIKDASAQWAQLDNTCQQWDIKP